MTGRRAIRVTVTAGSVLAAALTAHTALNLRALRRPPDGAAAREPHVRQPPAREPCVRQPPARETPAREPPAREPPAREPLSVLLPVRDEAARVAGCVVAILAALDDYGAATELVVCDDGSTDGTADVVCSAAAGDSRVRLIAAGELPAGWLGKPHACARLADAADPASSLLVFIDADVLLAPDGLTRSVALLRDAHLDVVCPYPRQLITGAAQRLVQPLLQWSWATTLPLRLAERSRRPSLTAGNGQLLLVDAVAYARAGGHRAVVGEVLEDIALVRAVKAAGGRGGIIDGTEIATCAMYDDARGMVAGYTKSLWTAFGSSAGAAVVAGVLCLAYVVPALAMLTASRDRAVRPIGALGYAAGVGGRVLVARRTGGRVWPDSLAHPVSVLAFTALLGRSVRHHRRGTLTWRGRTLTPGAERAHDSATHSAPVSSPGGAR